MRSLSKEFALSQIYTNQDVRVTATTMLGRGDVNFKQIVTVTVQESTASLPKHPQLQVNGNYVRTLQMGQTAFTSGITIIPVYILALLDLQSVQKVNDSQERKYVIIYSKNELKCCIFNN